MNIPVVFIANNEIYMKKVVAAVPHEGEEVMLKGACYKVIKRLWKFTDGSNMLDQDNVTITLEKL